MANSDKLFELIKSLTKHEKIYFKRSTKNNKNINKKYILLFDAIANQKEYDEQKIRQKFKNEQFVKQLSVAKDYLFKMIMKSLRIYDDFNPTIYFSLQQMLHDINILYDKALYHSCEKIIGKAKKIANDTEQFGSLSTILNFERKVILSRGENAENLKKLQTILKAQTTALEQKMNTILFRNLFDNFSVIAINSMTVRDKEKKKQIDKLLGNPLLRSVDNAKSFLSKLYFFNIHHLYYKQLRNRPQSYIYSSNAVNVFEQPENKQFIGEYKERYCEALVNLVIDQAWLLKKKEFNETMSKITLLLTKYSELKTIIFPRMYIAQTLLYDLLGEFDRVIPIVNKFEKEFKLFAGEIPKGRLTILYSNFSTLYMGLGDYKNALYWLNKVLNETPKELLVDFYRNTRILELIIHYELGNTQLLESLTRSVHRYLLQRGDLFKFEKAIINFMGIKLPKINNQRELIQAFKTLKKEFEILSKNNFEKAGMEIFDFISWMESKIENRLFADIVKEKRKQNH